MQSRRLLLIRHAQAANGAVDADRPLTAQGERRAAAIGSWLGQSGLAPDRVLVSPARRAAQTWELAGQGSEVPPIVDERIYDNTVEGLLEILRETPDDAATVAVVGHNPSIGRLAIDLDDGAGSPQARDDVAEGFPAGGVAVFSLPASFAAIEPGGGSLDDFTVPGS